MKPKSFELEIKVGTFVAVGIALVMFAIITLGGGVSIFSSSKSYYAHFDTVEGLVPGAKVVLGGIRVGVVQTFDLDPKSNDIKVSFKIQNEYTDWIREDSKIVISTQGVLGDKFVTIQSGSPTAKILPPGSQVPSEMGNSISGFINKGDQLLASLNVIAGSLQKILHSFEKDGRSERFFDGLAKTAANTANVTEKLDKQLDGQHLKKSLQHLDSILSKIDNGTGTLGALVNDPALYDQAKSLVGGANRNRVVRNLVRKTIQDAREKEE